MVLIVILILVVLESRCKMKEFIEKLVSRLEEEIDIIKDEVYRDYEERIIEECAIENVIDIVNELAEEYNNDFCEWKFTKSVVNGGYFYSSGCNHKRFSDLHNFEFCPYCGKKIKVVE